MPEIVEILLRNGASPSFWISSAIGSNYRFSPLQEAYAIGDERIINLLLTFGAKDISEHEKVQIAFIEAAANSSYSVSDLINFIQKGAIINEKNANNESALMKVIDIDLLFNLFNSNQIRKYMYLLDNGADPNMTAYCSWDDGYATPLHSLIYYTSYNFKNDPNDATCIMLIDKLLKAGAFVSSTDRWGDTPLHTAAEYNNLTGANMLIAAGCKIMAKGYQGKTPLDYAKSGEMIKLLKANGATE
jgi:ankyrin repeat protein